MSKTVVKRYAEGLKRQVVREYEAGQSVYALQQKYGIGAHVTIKRWIEKYGSAGYRTKQVVIQSAEDQQEYKAMKARIRELEAALAESVLNARMLEAVLDAASEGLNMDLKKTFGRQP